MKGLRADSVDLDTMQKLADAHLDITGAANVEIIKRQDGKVIWVNVNGVCVLRICQIQELGDYTRTQ